MRDISQKIVGTGFWNIATLLSGAEFTAVMQAVDDVCCEPTDQEGDVCTDGRLLACGTACARIVGPMYVQCEAFLRSYDSSILALMDAARAVCELAGH